PKAAPSASLERKAQGEKLAQALKPQRPDDFEAQLKASARTRKVALIGAGAIIATAALAYGGLMVRKSMAGLPRAAVAKIEKAHARLLLDDTGSLEAAGALFTEAARLSPGEAAPEAERAFTLLLLAASHKDLADRLEVAAKDLNEQLAKLQMDKPEGWES